MKVLVKGYYGQENLGDEAILLAMLLGLSKRGIQATVSAGKRRALFPEVFSLSGTEAKIVDDDFWSEMKTLPSVDALVIGGGGLFPRGRLGLPLRLLVMSTLFALCGKPTFMIGIGVNPIRHGLTKFIWRCLAALSKGIVVRDKSSYAVLEDALGAALARKKLQLSTDLVFTANPQIFTTQKSSSQGRRLAIVLARPWNAQEHATDEGKQRFGILLEGLRSLITGSVAAGWQVDLVPFFAHSDVKFAEEITRDGMDGVNIVRDETMTGRLASIASSDAVLTMRFHGLVFGISFDKPTALIAYDHKMAQLADEVGIADQMVKLGMREHEYFGFKADVDFERLRLIMSDVLQQSHTTEDAARVTALRQTAARNFNALDQYIGNPALA